MCDQPPPGKDDAMNERTVGARWYETPTGLLVPIPPISGGGEDVSSPAAPAAPAPAAPAAPAPSAGSAPAPAAPAAPAPVSPPPDAAGIRSIIDGILSDPRLGPLAKERLAPALGPPGAVPSAPAAGDDPRYVRAFEEYQKAPNDQAAFIHLMKVASELGRDGALSAVEAREIEQVNQTRQHQTHVAIATAVNDAVTKDAPDVDLELFWSYGRRAQAETPRHLTNRSERIEWQKNRAVELARAKQAQIRGAAASAGVVTPGRPGTAPPAAPGAPGGPKRMIDQIRDLRRSQYPS